MKSYLVAFCLIMSVPLFVHAELAELEDTSDAVSSQLGNIRGLIKPRDQALLSSEILARITKMPFRGGQRFRKGDVLVKFDCSRFNAELAAARAELVAREKTHQNNRELERLNAIGKLEVEVSAAEADKAAADVRVKSVIVNGCVIRAPYDGRVVENKAHEHETVSPNQELMNVLDERILEIELIVPSNWLTWLTVGTPFTFYVDETGQEYEARVAELGARVDPVSQTIRVDGIFYSGASNVLAGMSGTASFSIPE